jgi:hypothetical protein
MKERRLRVFENRLLRRIFRPKRDEDWRKLHDEDRHNLYSLPGIVMITRVMGGANSTHDKKINAQRILIRNTVEKRPLG